MLGSQQRFKSEKHNVYTKKTTKIVFSANDAYGRSRKIVHKKKKLDRAI